MKRLCFIFVLGILLVGGLLPAYSQEDDPIFMQASPDPIIERGSPGDWDYAYNDPGAVIFHDGKFHMFNNGFDGWPTTSGIGYYTSEDGIVWEAQTEDPIFQSGDYEFDGFAMVATSAIVTEEGEWRLYLTQLKAHSFSNIVGVSFKLLVADDPLGEWTLLDEDLLSPGSNGEWDEHQISDPMVLETEDGYVMYYSGFDLQRMPRIGMAVSEDGMVWEKYDDPDTNEAPFAESDPIMQASLEWERGVHYPAVLEADEGYVMVYRSPGNGTSMRLGMAISEDGMVWEKYEEPVYAPNAIPGNGASNITALVQHEDTYFLYIDAFVGGAFSLPYVLTHEGALFGEE